MNIYHNYKDYLSNTPTKQASTKYGPVAAKVRSPNRPGKIPKGVPVMASGDTPLPVTEIIHANPHEAREIGSLSSNNTSRRSAKILEAKARADRLETTQEEMRTAQENMSSQLEVIPKTIADLPTFGNNQGWAHRHQ